MSEPRAFSATMSDVKLYSSGISLSTLYWVSLLACFMIAIFHVVGVYFDSYDGPAKPHDITFVLSYLWMFVPLAVISCLLAYLFWYHLDGMLRPMTLALATILLLLLGLPIIVLNANVVELLSTKQSLTLLLTKWRTTRVPFLWVDACLILGVLFSHAAFASWRRSVMKEVEMAIAESESIDLRLHLLHGQLKPHFLFNALNSINALIRGADRRMASMALQRLKGLLRYVIDSSKFEWMSVAQEMQFVRDYLDMQMLRFGDRMTLNWDIQDAAWENYSCAPLLFQPLVENAIHHGVEKHHEQCVIRLHLRCEQDKIHFEIENRIVAEAVKAPGHGMGLSSTKERLEILYQGAAQVNITETPDHFKAELVFPTSAGLSFQHPATTHAILNRQE